MKTTLEIDADLLETAQQALGTTTIRGTVEASLKEVVRYHGLQALADSLGAIPIELTSEQLRRHRKKRVPHVPH